MTSLKDLERCPKCKSADIMPWAQDMKICNACDHRWYPAAEWVGDGQLGVNERSALLERHFGAVALGKIKTPKKAAASRKNGKLGGRPKLPRSKH